MKLVLIVLGVVFAIVGLALLMAIPTMLAWNYVMPYLFKLPEVSLSQAFAMNVLSGALVKSSLHSKG